MSKYFEEVYFDVEKAIELAFDRKFVLNFYEYLKLKGSAQLGLRSGLMYGLGGFFENGEWGLPVG